MRRHYAERGMTHRLLPAVLHLQDWAVWGALALFLLFHTGIWIGYNFNRIQQHTFRSYALAAEVGTHVFALPAILTKNVEGIREQIVVATLVSTIFHTANNYFDNVVDVHPWNCLDRGVATALIGTIFLKYLAHVHRTNGILIFIAALASSFEFGNILASSIVSLVLVAVLILPLASTLVQDVLRGLIAFLSLGSVPENTFSALNYNEKQRRLLFTTLGFQVASVFAYLIGENKSDLEHWAHSIWHALAYLALYLLVLVLVEEHLKPSCPRLSREDYSNPVTRELSFAKTALMNFRMM